MHVTSHEKPNHLLIGENITRYEWEYLADEVKVKCEPSVWCPTIFVPMIGS